MSGDPGQPLAERMRPRRLEEVVGQQHLLDGERGLRASLARGRLHSMVFWGPPGTGKTTLARLLADAGAASFVTLSAVTSGVKDIRDVVAAARKRRADGERTVLFVDEVHRFNTAQQDAFLPHVEDGTLVFIGATTENPSFALNNALLSRLRVSVLRPLERDDIVALLRRALTDAERGLSRPGLQADEEALALIAAAADGDARRALMLLEVAADLVDAMIDRTVIADLVKDGPPRRFDKRGDAFYDQISALHKSVRGSSPDGALYWLCRMLDGGCDPLYLARRLVRIASEDIGNADPRALQLALAAWDAQHRLGSPEGELALAQAAVYLASVPKSDAVYRAFGAAMQDAREHGSPAVPMHLRNAPTRLMAALGHGRDYRHAHEEPDGYAAGEQYLPDALADRSYYHPLDRGLEIRIGERLKRLAERDRQARKPGATSTS